MRITTTLEESRELAEILPHSTADMTYMRTAIVGHNLDVPEGLQYILSLTNYQFFSGIGVPAWSLGALLNVIPKVIMSKNDDGLWLCTSNGNPLVHSGWFHEPVNACVEVITQLNKNGVL